MSEYGLLAASAAVSALTNVLGLARRGRIRRVLVVKVDHLGDVVTATPALRALREAHPRATIDLLVAPALAPLFTGGGLVSRAIPYESPRFRRRPGTDASPGGAAPAEAPPATRSPSPRAGATLRAVTTGGYDTVVELRGDWTTLRVPFAARACRRVDRGTVRLRDWTARRLGRGARPPLHEVETNLAVVRPLLPRAARDAPPPAPEVREDPGAAGRMRARLEDAGVDFSRPILAIHPGAFWRPRAWRGDRFAAIGARLAVDYGLQPVFVGSADERDVEAAVRAAWRGPRAAFLFGTLTVAELASFFRSAKILVGNDSGVAHLAAACGTPTIALFGPQDPRRFRPWSPTTRVLHHRVDCFPCDQTICVRPDLPCVNLIEVAEVEAVARELLRAPAASWPGAGGDPGTEASPPEPTEG